MSFLGPEPRKVVGRKKRNLVGTVRFQDFVSGVAALQLESLEYFPLLIFYSVFLSVLAGLQTPIGTQKVAAALLSGLVIFCSVWGAGGGIGIDDHLPMCNDRLGYTT